MHPITYNTNQAKLTQGIKSQDSKHPWPGAETGREGAQGKLLDIGHVLFLELEMFYL